MDSSSWSKIKELLDEALRIEPAGRMVFLESAGLKGEMLSEIESLLKVDAQSADFMTLDVADFSKDFVVGEGVGDTLVGQSIGIYEIIRELGFGGMGAVYLAERTDGKFSQKVAVKMLKRELNTVKLRRHFRHEREILSRLNHPNIAHLIDAGKTDDGVPYLVMEYVEGLPIDEYCKRHELSLVSRLKLFNKVAEAVAFAHRNLIIHRDLKPSNILVTEKGEPKLLDFGISKLVDLNENTVVTLLGAMTPDYASPEQIKGEPVSTSSDIYSLGIVLFKMLTGSLPFDLTGKNNGELLKTVIDGEPTTPSSVVAGSNFQANSDGKERMVRSLKGDLDNIILKAISKEPERRYNTVEQFSADIWRHLDGLPVLARPATMRYHAYKFFKRNRLSITAAVLILVSLIGGIGIALWQAREAQAQARKSELETQKAREEQRKSEKVTKFVSKIFDYANPGWFSPGAKSQGKARVIDVVEELSGKIDTEFADEADVAASLHQTFAGIFHWVSKNAPPDQVEAYQQKRRRHALRGLELRRKFYGDYHQLVAVDMFGTYGMVGTTEEERSGFLMSAILMLKNTNPKNTSLPFLYEAYVARLILPEFEPIHQATLNAVMPPTDENKYQVGERMLREAIPLLEASYPADHPVVLDKKCWFAFALAKQDKWTEFDAPYDACKQIETRAKSEEIFRTILPSAERVEKLIENRKR